MDKTRWENKAATGNDYYDNQPGIDVTEAGVTMTDEPAYDPSRKPRYNNHATYRTRDIWQAAALDCYGIALLGARRLETGKTEWEFDNAEDKAWTTGMEFRSGQLVATLRDFRSSYRKMMNAADMARREGYMHDDRAA